jgi:hypothetical protein
MLKALNIEIGIEKETNGDNPVSILSIPNWEMLFHYGGNISVKNEINGKERELLMSAPPEGKYPVKNLYIDPATRKLIIEYDDGG